jgi:hypothetical protein
MRRLIALTVCLISIAGLGSGTAAAAKEKLVEGTVYDTTCAAATCEPECPPPPHCGPITGRDARIACPLRWRRIVACPLSATVAPIYSGEGAVVKVRKRGSSTALATLPVSEGHFKIHLAAGEYVLNAIPPEEPQCWTHEPVRITVDAKVKGPIAAALDIGNTCVAHPDSR